MSEPRAYSGKQFALAVSLAALLGWAAIVIPATLLSSERPVPMDTRLSFLLFAGIIGLPIAFISSWIVAGPILWRVMARTINWSRAAAWGLIIPAAMAIVGVILGRLYGLVRYLDPNTYSSSYGPPGVPIEIDGILMPYGWWLTAESSAKFIAIGFVVALIVRAVIGPGSIRSVEGEEKTAAESS